jgi:NADH dehydrogenase/NADH:ubiquinone oxidoreductase subunit G
MSIEQQLERIAVGVEAILENLKATATPTTTHEFVQGDTVVVTGLVEKPKKKKKTKAAKKKEEPIEEVEEPTEEVKEEAPKEMEAAATVVAEPVGATMDELESALRENVRKMSGPEWALKVLNQYGATKLSEISPENVGAIYDKLAAKNNE